MGFDFNNNINDISVNVIPTTQIQVTFYCTIRNSRATYKRIQELINFDKSCQAKLEDLSYAKIYNTNNKYGETHPELHELDIINNTSMYPDNVLTLSPKHINNFILIYKFDILVYNDLITKIKEVQNICRNNLKNSIEISTIYFESISDKPFYIPKFDLDELDYELRIIYYKYTLTFTNFHIHDFIDNIGTFKTYYIRIYQSIIDNYYRSKILANYQLNFHNTQIKQKHNVIPVSK